LWSKLFDKIIKGVVAGIRCVSVSGCD